MSKLSKTQVMEICDKFEAANGRPSKCAVIKRLALEFGVTVPSINYQLLRNGIDPWDSTQPTHPNQPGAFSADEDQRMLALVKKMGIERAAKVLGRPRTSVRIRVMTLEVRAEKAMEAA